MFARSQPRGFLPRTPPRTTCRWESFVKALNGSTAGAVLLVLMLCVIGMGLIGCCFRPPRCVGDLVPSSLVRVKIHRNQLTNAASIFPKPCGHQPLSVFVLTKTKSNHPCTTTTTNRTIHRLGNRAWAAWPQGGFPDFRALLPGAAAGTSPASTGSHGLDNVRTTHVMADNSWSFIYPFIACGRAIKRLRTRQTQTRKAAPVARRRQRPNGRASSRSLRRHWSCERLGTWSTRFGVGVEGRQQRKLRTSFQLWTVTLHAAFLVIEGRHQCFD